MRRVVLVVAACIACLACGVVGFVAGWYLALPRYHAYRTTQEAHLWATYEEYVVTLPAGTTVVATEPLRNGDYGWLAHVEILFGGTHDEAAEWVTGEQRLGLDHTPYLTVGSPPPTGASTAP